MYTVEQVCNDCKNETICKFTKEMKEAQELVATSIKSTTSPIHIEVECGSFERKHQKQDGFPEMFRHS